MRTFERLGVHVTRSRALTMYVVVVTGAAVSVASVMVLTGSAIRDPAVVAALAAAAAVGERGQVQLGSKVRVSIALLPALFAAVIFGPLAAMIVYASSMLMRWDVSITGRCVFASSRALTGAAAA